MRRYTLEIGDQEFVVDVNELAIDSFEVMVGGDAYVVTLSGEEDLPDAAAAPQPENGAAPVGGAAPTPRVRVARATPASAPGAAAQKKPPRTGGAALNAPMPGVIIDIAVKTGDAVARGQLVAVLDAMKMHNNIKSPRAGTIAEVCVAPGQAVGHGDAIVRFRED